MSERIKRYHVPGPWTPTENEVGDWCRSTDVDAIEAENVRLRGIEESFRIIVADENELCDGLNKVLDKHGLDIGEGTYAKAFDAELTRLRRIVEAADKLRHFATNPPTCASEGDELEAAVAAYDAAKAQQHAKGEKAT